MRSHQGGPPSPSPGTGAGVADADGAGVGEGVGAGVGVATAVSGTTTPLNGLPFVITLGWVLLSQEPSPSVTSLVTT